MERPARRRLAVHEGRLLRPHRGALCLDMAACALRRAARAVGGSRDAGLRGARLARRDRRRAGGGRHGSLDLHVGRLQALHQRGLPGCLPDRGADPHRVPDRAAAGRRLQRVRLLHPGLPVRRRRPRPHRRPGRQVHAVLRPLGGRAGARVREGLPDRFDPVRTLRRAGRACRAAGGRAAPARRGERVSLRRRRRARARPRGRPRGVLPADRADPSASGCRPRPSRRSRRTSSPRRSRQLAPGCLRPPAPRSRSRPRGEKR